MIKILLVEYDNFVASTCSSYLAQDECIVDRVSSGYCALGKLRGNTYDVALLSWAPPDMGATELCRRHRDMNGTTALLVMGEEELIAVKTAAFSAGADDFLSKPFDPVELCARVRALSRRSRSYRQCVIQCGNLTLDADARRVYKGDTEIRLLAKEFNLLELMMRNPDHNFTAEALLDRVWNSNSSSSETVRTHIKTLRQKLGAGAENQIVTRRGIGYSLASEKSSEVKYA
jgi:DNA-binding response OmpR family regulator